MSDFMKKYVPIYSNPVEWSGAIVKNWFRFLLYGVFLTYLTLDIFSKVAENGIESSRYGITMIVFFQFMNLYALRRLYKHITDKEGSD